MEARARLTRSGEERPSVPTPPNSGRPASTENEVVTMRSSKRIGPLPASARVLPTVARADSDMPATLRRAVTVVSDVRPPGGPSGAPLA